MTTSAKKSPQRLMLLDSASLYFRAFFGVPDDHAPDGTPVNAVRGLSTSSRGSSAQYRPDPARLLLGQRLAARVAGRPDPVVQGPPRRVRRRRPGRTSRRCPTRSRPRCRSSSTCSPPSGSPCVGADGYEADDVIGTLATGAGRPGRRGHRRPRPVPAGRRRRRRAGPLHRPRGRQPRARRPTTWMRAKYGVDGAQYADFATLRGDASDGLPGVAGIGEKTAATLLCPVRRPGRDHRGRERPRLRPRSGAARQDQGLRRLPGCRSAGRGRRPRHRPGPDGPRSSGHPRDPGAVTDLAKRYNLESPAARLVEALIR